MKHMSTNDPRTITIGPVRFSYLNCFEAKVINGKGDPKYSVSAIIPKKDKKTLEKIEAAIEAAIELGKDSKWGGKIPKKLKNPLRDGDDDREDDEPYKKSMFFNCSNSNRPGVVGPDREPITDKDEVYSGAYGYLNVTFFPYDSNGSQGVGVSFNHLMKTADGEKLSGRISVDEAFGDIEVAGSDLM